jgi:adenosine deaminase
MSINEIISSVIDGMSEAEEKFKIKSNLILGCMRNMSEEDAIDVIKAGEKFLGRGVVAVDLCGGEEEGFCHKFKNSIDIARKLGYNVTIHAGEAASAMNVVDSVNLLGATRIGHGVRTRDLEEAYNLVKEKNITLEVCPTSNLQTKAVLEIENHPVFDYFKDEIMVTINTDNRTVSNVKLSDEIKLFLENIQKSKDLVTQQDLKSVYKKIYINAVESSFADSETKKYLKLLL